jgi:hypothetical protein
MLEFFKMARGFRKPYFKEMSLVDLMSYGAEEAGCHLEYVANLQNKNKYQVRYNKQFSSAVLAELVCRMEPNVMSILKKRDFDISTIDSYISYGFFNFIKTYKPDVHNTDEKIRNAVYNSVIQKIEQLSRKEKFKYVPGYKGVTRRERELAEKEGREPKARYVNTCKEVSIHTPVYGRDDEQSGELGDFIPDSMPTPEEKLINKCEKEELCIRYSDDQFGKILLEVIIDSYSDKRLSVNELKESALNNEDFRELVAKEFGFNPNDNFELPPEFEDKLYRKIKVFYRNLKKKLKIEFNIN